MNLLKLLLAIILGSAGGGAISYKYINQKINTRIDKRLNKQITEKLTEFEETLAKKYDMVKWSDADLLFDNNMTLQAEQLSDEEIDKITATPPEFTQQPKGDSDEKTVIPYTPIRDYYDNPSNEKISKETKPRETMPKSTSERKSTNDGLLSNRDKRSSHQTRKPKKPKNIH